MLIHGAIIAREYGLPCVTGVPDATARIETGDRLTVDGYLGIVTVSHDEETENDYNDARNRSQEVEQTVDQPTNESHPAAGAFESAQITFGAGRRGERCLVRIGRIVEWPR